VATEIKFCGLTRSTDARQAVALGASYVGVIFAGGPRHLTPERASDVLAEVPVDVRRVGVFAAQPVEEIVAVAEQLQLAVVQLHGECDLRRIETLRRRFAGEIWPVLRIAGATVAPDTIALALATKCDAILLDAMAPGALGGTGITLPWGALAASLDQLRAAGKIVLAGGLRPDNVAQAIAALSPDVVDVSSGVEQAGLPGIKDHQRMRAFRDAVVQSSQILT
jgi:phosphoribosylanthranilate isomerase